MEKAFRYGLTEANMKATGSKTEQTGEVDSSMLTGMFTKDSGWTTKQMATEAIFTLMERTMWDTGKRTNSMDMELKYDQTMRSIRGLTSWGGNMASGSSNEQMDLHMKASFLITISKAKATMSGQTAGSTQAPGKTTKWMERECSRE